MQIWHRLEPNSSDTNLDEGLAARLADPLWSIARQWQLGEFKGEDAASPISVQLRADTTPLRSVHFESRAEQGARKISSGEALEPLVEAEDVVNGPSAVSQAAEAGVQFLRRLNTAGLSVLRKDVDWVGKFGFDLDAEPFEIAEQPLKAQRRLELLVSRCPDGRRLFATSPASLVRMVRSSDRSAFRKVVDAWRAEYDGRFAVSGSEDGAWIEDRIEYDFTVAASAGHEEVLLRVEEHTGGRLDWSSYRVDRAATHNTPQVPMEERELQLLPQPITFSGQPASRWWEFEDRRVYFGNLSAGPADLTRLTVAEFAATFSDDWFVVPLRVGTGSLNRVTRLVVRDVFGGETHVQSLAENDHAEQGIARPFRLFELEGDSSVEEGAAPWLLVPPVLEATQHREVEDITFVRDEQANLAWAIESRIELPTGQSMRRRQEWKRKGDAWFADRGLRGSGISRNGEEAESWRYKLQSTVPPWWIPFLPTRAGEGAAIGLRRARMQAWSEDDQNRVGPMGRILAVPRPLVLKEEEVPRGGIQVHRSWRRSRLADGSVRVWQGRRKRPGRGDRGSGLEFDAIEASQDGGQG